MGLLRKYFAWEDPALGDLIDDVMTNKALRVRKRQLEKVLRMKMRRV